MTEDSDLTDAPAGAVPDDDPHPLDTGVRRTLRDLIPDYSGPPDPLPRVRLSIRRRRSRRRALLAVGSAATAAALVSAVPAVLTVRSGTQRGGQPPAADGPAPSVATGTPAPPPALYPVSAGTVAGAAWRVGSTSPGGAAHRCLLSDGGGFDRDLVCFDEWRQGDPLTWQELVVRAGSTATTRVAGVAPADAAAVLVRPVTGVPVRTRAVRTATDPAARFFAVVLVGDVPVRSVTALSPDGTPLGAPVTEPAAPSCRPAPDNACAAPAPTG